METKTTGKNLVLPGAGAHVLAQASVEVENVGVEETEVTCHLAWEGMAGGVAHAFGEPSVADLAGSSVTRAEIPLTANVSLVGAETYDLQVLCGTGSLTSSAKSLSAAINAFGPE